MDLITWDKTLSIGIKSIDKEHQKLVNIINALDESIKSRSSKRLLDKVLNELINYVAYHFSNEEDYFKKYDYPEADLHREQHNMFVSELGKLTESLNKMERDISADILAFLVKWYQKHILIFDKKYASFLISKGVK